MSEHVIDEYRLVSGCRCAVARTWGCNLISWIVDNAELMYCPPELPESASKITGGGNPILFPAVGRTWELSGEKPVLGPYRIYGTNRLYQMPNHGIVFKSLFERTGLMETPYLVTATYDMQIPEQVLEENYPFEVRLTQSFTAKPDRIDLWARIVNADTRPAPVAFGYHPYFRVSNPDRTDVEIRLPATKEIILTPDTVLPTGETRDFDGVLKLATGVSYDNLYTGLVGTRMSLVDKQARRVVHVDFDLNTEFLVVYAPDNSEFVCIEPWTRGLGAFMNLNHPDWEKTDAIRILQPGKAMFFSATFSIEPLR